MLSRVKITPVRNDGIGHKVFIDGIEQHNISALTTKYNPLNIPTVSVTYNCIPEIDEIADVKAFINSASIENNLAAVLFAIQYDDELKNDIIDILKESLHGYLKDGGSVDEIAKDVYERLRELCRSSN